MKMTNTLAGTGLQINNLRPTYYAPRTTYHDFHHLRPVRKGIGGVPQAYEHSA
jgi:hypothetical protein